MLLKTEASTTTSTSTSASNSRSISITNLCSCSPSLVKAILLLSPRQRPFKPDLLRGVVNVCDTWAAEHYTHLQVIMWIVNLRIANHRMDILICLSDNFWGRSNFKKTLVCWKVSPPRLLPHHLLQPCTHWGGSEHYQMDDGQWLHPLIICFKI